MRTMKVVINSQCEIDYTVRGSGSPILFIQGVGVQGDGWLPQVDVLADHFRCITFDNRGLGRSRWDKPEELSVQQMARDAQAVLAHANCPQAHVVGHSLGGTVALALALQAREAVSSLSLLCTFPSGALVAPLTLRMLWFGLRSRIGTRKMRRSGFLGLVLPPCKRSDSSRLADQLSHLFGHDIADQPPIANRQLRALKRAELSNQLGQLTGLPTLVISAQHDLIAPPESGRAIAERIPGARFVEVAAASHGLPITHAKLTNELLGEFFREHR